MMFLNMRSRFLLFAFELFSEFEEFRFHFSYWHVPKLCNYVHVVFFYSNISLKHKLVIEPNSPTECWYSTKQEVYSHSKYVVFAIRPPGILPPLHFYWTLTRPHHSHLRQNGRQPLWDQQPPLGQCLSGTRNCIPATLHLTIPVTRPLKNAVACIWNPASCSCF